RILNLQQKLLATQKMLEIRTTHNELTELWNRTAILERLTKELNRAEREMASVRVILLDLDHFKRINDTYDHMVGNQILKESTHRITLAVRSYDRVGRYKGDEFLIIAPNYNNQTTVQMTKKIYIKITITPFVIPNSNLTVTINANTS